MKRSIFALSLLLSFSACESTWDGETQDMFRQSCLEDANKLTDSPAQAKTYCDCVLEKTMKKYPQFADALEHPDSLIADPDIQKCKELLRK